jgi:peptidoglycan/LPS O-acetylase OafA/YrhL
MVFAYHLNANAVLRIPRAINVGYTGVAFFFVLSGFVLTWSTSSSMSKLTFWRNRFARIWPATAVSTIVALLLPIPGWHGENIAGVVLQFLLLQAWVPNASVALAANGLTWSLSCEAAFYAALPFVLPVLIRAPRRKRFAVALVYFAAASTVVAVIAAKQPGVTWENVAYFNPALRFGEFLLGVVAALEVRDGHRMSARVAATLVAVSLIGLAATRAYPLPNELLTPLFLAVIVMAAQWDLRRPAGWLASRPFIYAGEVSFAFYLVHQITMVNIARWVGHGGAEVALLSLVASCVAAVALHHVIELPFQRVIRGRKSAAASIATHLESNLGIQA